MEHRHLNHQRYTLAAIDDVIARGQWNDWVALRRAVHADDDVAHKVARVTRPRLSDPLAQRHHFWANYVNR